MNVNEASRFRNAQYSNIQTFNFIMLYKETSIHALAKKN